MWEIPLPQQNIVLLQSLIVDVVYITDGVLCLSISFASLLYIVYTIAEQDDEVLNEEEQL